MHPLNFALGIIVGTVFASAVVFAWTGPTSAPPNGNVSAPVNVGTTDQIKNAGLALNALAVFGNSILSGPSVTYLNFGATSGSTGYGIRDNVGTMEFKSSGGSWASIQSTIATLCGDGACGSGGSGSVVAFSVNKGVASQAVPAATHTLITWPTEVFDTNNNFASNRFTPTVAGKYLVSLNILCVGTNNYCMPMIYKNGVSIANGESQNSGSTQDPSVSITVIVDMNGSTDYLEAYGYTTGTTFYGGDSNGPATFFSGALLSPQGGSGSGTTQTTAATAPNNSKMYQNTPQTIPAGPNGSTYTKITLDTTEFDNSGMADSANHRIDITKASTYLITGSFYGGNQSATGRFIDGLIYKNGSVLFWARTPMSTNLDGIITVSGVATLANGDYIELFARPQDNAFATNNSIGLRPQLAVVEIDN